MNFQEFKKEVNAARRTGQWYTFQVVVEGTSIALKGYKTWLQIYQVSGVNWGNCCDVSVKQFNIDLEKPFENRR